MDTHHPAIAAAEEEAAQAYMDRCDAEAIRPVMLALAKLKNYPVTPWMMAAMGAGVLALTPNMNAETRDCADGYLRDLVDDMKGFHRDRC